MVLLVDLQKNCENELVSVFETAPIVFIVRQSSRLTLMDPSIAGKLSDSTATIDELKALVNQFVTDRSWESFHSPKNLSMSIAIEAAELMEHFQWTNPNSPTHSLANDSPIAQELSDVLAYSLALANTLGIDLSRALESKMKRNELKYPIGAEYVPKGISSSG